MHWEQLADLIRGRWRFIVTVTVTMMSLVCVVNLAMPARYRATASVLVDTRGVDPIAPAATRSPDEAATLFATTANIARSEGLARRVAALRPGSSRVHDAVKPAAGTDPVALEARDLLAHLSVLPGGQNTHVLDIRYAATDPRSAADLANAFAAALIDYSVELRLDPARADAKFFDEQAASLRDKLDRSQSVLSAFQREHHITTSDERTDAEAARLKGLGAELTSSQAEQVDRSARDVTGTAPDTLPDVVSQPVIQTLTGDVARFEAQVGEMSARYGPNYPQLIAARSQLEAARKTLSRQVATVTQSLRNASRSSDRKRSMLARAVDVQQGKVMDVVALRPQLETLQTDVLEARKAYQIALSRRSEVGLQARYQPSEIRLLSAAVATDQRVRPGLPILLAGGFLLGTLAGLMLALAWDRVRPRIRGRLDLEALGLPILAEVPALRAGRSPTLPHTRRTIASTVG